MWTWRSEQNKLEYQKNREFLTAHFSLKFIIYDNLQKQFFFVWNEEGGNQGNFSDASGSHRWKESTTSGVVQFWSKTASKDSFSMSLQLKVHKQGQ